ncbi:MAG: hypothetical protein E6K80_13700 [Candidatus Eisenbacteria bacterium]|uniref:Exonuclease VII large subunit C-terminal domain-containing protein n=1 Tax=Eiseniibacteriota bacterium TaxID=2212470 RepID=A0A538TYV6_UNCEI|nr:MAG: hypothetical protein E6K80_13700 [Candidatus Eisenbacteria bacterium]
MPARRRDHAPGRYGRSAVGARGAEEEAAGRGVVRRRAQAPVAALSAARGSRDLAGRRRDPRPGESIAGAVAGDRDRARAGARARTRRGAGVIVARGGGSFEDLWSFNEEPVARAIGASRLPVISGIGHEADVTLADLVADVRAATPTHAAQLAVPDRREIADRIENLRHRIARVMKHELERRRQRLDHVLGKYGFRDLLELFTIWRGAVDAHVVRARQAMSRRFADLRRRLEAASGAYGLREWPRQIEARRARVVECRRRLDESVAARFAASRLRARGYADRLRALSPRRVLERGYCLARGPDGTLLRAAAAVSVGDAIHVEFARGEVDARVEAVRGGEDHGPTEVGAAPGG